MGTPVRQSAKKRKGLKPTKKRGKHKNPETRKAPEALESVDGCGGIVVFCGVHSVSGKDDEVCSRDAKSDIGAMSDDDMWVQNPLSSPSAESYHVEGSEAVASVWPFRPLGPFRRALIKTLCTVCFRK